MDNELTIIHTLLDHTSLRDHLQQQTDNIAICASDGEIVFVNNAWRSFSQENDYLGPDFIGQNYLSICQISDGAESPDGNAVYAGLKGVAAGVASSFSHMFPCHSVTENRWFRLTAVPLIAAGGARTGSPLLITHANVTDDIERLTPEFLAENDAQFAHDLKSSLNPLMGFVQLTNLAVRDLPNNEKSLKFLAEAEKYGHHIVDFLGDVIEHGKQFGTLDDRTQVVDVVDVVRSCVERYAGNRENVRVTFHSHFETDLKLICARDALMRMADNLVSNAVKYNCHDGWVNVSVGLNRSGGIVLSVKDGGIGIEEHVLPSIFDAYERGHHNKASGIRGHGLGLSSTRRLVERFGASIGVESLPGIGSTFSIAFPQWRTAGLHDNLDSVSDQLQADSA